MKGSYSLVSETPEMERVKANQRHISSVQYREEVGRGTAVMDTPEMERVRRNQENISSFFPSLSEHPGHPIMLLSYITQWSLSVLHQVKYRQSAVKATSVGSTPELERVRQNQENISSARHTHTHTHKGRSCTELDTPEYRRVRRTQDSVSMVAARLPWLPPGLWEELT
uniref:Uncharacterized protein n=1 Tax=Lates calcarifer TaxID=8187 RepID=A0A4W6FU45_LATCA